MQSVMNARTYITITAQNQSENRKRTEYLFTSRQFSHFLVLCLGKQEKQGIYESYKNSLRNFQKDVASFSKSRSGKTKILLRLFLQHVAVFQSKGFSFLIFIYITPPSQYNEKEERLLASNAYAQVVSEFPQSKLLFTHPSFPF